MPTEHRQIGGRHVPLELLLLKPCLLIRTLSKGLFIAFSSPFKAFPKPFQSIPLTCFVNAFSRCFEALFKASKVFKKALKSR